MGRPDKKGHDRGSGRGGLRKTYLGRLRKIFGVRADVAERLASIKLESSIRINALSPLGHDEILSRLNEFGAKIDPISWCPGAYHFDFRLVISLYLKTYHAI